MKTVLVCRGASAWGKKKWHAKVLDPFEELCNALLPDYIVLGGGNAANPKQLPPQTRRADNADAFVRGFRLWEEQRPNAAGPAGIGQTIADDSGPAGAVDTEHETI